MNSTINQYKAFEMQRGKSDCGVACLFSIIRFYKGDCGYDALRIWSSANKNGTSLKGLKEAANQMGMEAEAFLVEELIDFKKEATFPCILHIINCKMQNHFIICCEPPNKNSFTIFDPVKGFENWNENQLLSVWKSRAVLLLVPHQNFIKVRFE